MSTGISPVSPRFLWLLVNYWPPVKTNPPFLDAESTKTLIHAFVTSRVDYTATRSQWRRSQVKSGG